MTQPFGRNDRVGKIKEVIANTMDNIGDTEETLENVSLSGAEQAKLHALNQRREQSVEAFKQALDEEFSD
ncbi:MAG: hypothetical protein OWT28_07075 [Firmicutes bacterium]|nr:hypothetical protein [Bacillota bacterium]